MTSILTRLGGGSPEVQLVLVEYMNRFRTVHWYHRDNQLRRCSALPISLCTQGRRNVISHSTSLFVSHPDGVQIPRVCGRQLRGFFPAETVALHVARTVGSSEARSTVNILVYVVQCSQVVALTTVRFSRSSAVRSARSPTTTSPAK